MSTSPTAPARRPLKSRQKPWAQALARILTRAGVAPNTISTFSAVFALIGGICLWQAGQMDSLARGILFISAAACIQLRLLCNLMDGLVAIEGGRKTSYGEVFNDMPDRFADVVILVGAGYSIPSLPWAHELGWLAAVLAVITAYIRVFGGSVGLQQSFIGPMAKQHRMALLTGACVLSAFEGYVGMHGQIVVIALALMIVGEIITCIRRTVRIVADLKKR